MTTADATISNNEATQGGGIYVEGMANQATTGMINMYGGTIEDNEALEHGGGVRVASNAIFNLRGTIAKRITNNEAEYDGGGVWLAQTASMRMATTAMAPVANNLYITNNTAGRMGGGIFTQDHGNYPNPLTTVTPGGVAVHFQNLTLLQGTHFSGNSANELAAPPVNVLPPAIPLTTLPNINWTSLSPASPHPGHLHPLNNYDINFRTVDILFEFLKTDYQIYREPTVINLLENARFRVFRAPVGSVNADTGLVTLDSLGEPNSPWEAVPASNLVNMVSSLNYDEPVAFYVTPGFVYQLEEYQAPVNFQPPAVQWRIEIAGGIQVQTIGTGFPSTDFRYIPCTCVSYICNISCAREVSWLLGNIPTFELPLTGGEGQGNNMVMFTIVGMGVTAIGLIVHFANKKLEPRH